MIAENYTGMLLDTYLREMSNYIPRVIYHWFNTVNSHIFYLHGHMSDISSYFNRISNNIKEKNEYML